MNRVLPLVFVAVRVVVFLVICTFALEGTSVVVPLVAQKTVHVKEYKRKDGTTVKAHDRKAPKSSGSSGSSGSKSGGSTSSTAKSTSSSKSSSTAKTTTASSTSTTHPSNYCATCARDSKGRILRGSAATTAFKRQTGFPNGRPGYVIDHIIPLACGGADNTANMQWQTIQAAKAKDKTERASCH